MKLGVNWMALMLIKAPLREVPEDILLVKEAT
jgi:hypothetical protein